MKNNLICFVILISGFNTLLAQDTVQVPEQAIPQLIEFQNHLNKPTSKLPIIGIEELNQKKDFESIKSTADLIRNSLSLEYIDYYSAINPNWEPEEHFKNYFDIKAVFDPYKGYHFNELDFIIDTTKNSTILNSGDLALEKGLSITTDETDKDPKRKLSKRIKPDKNFRLDLSGKLYLSVKYLRGYDTIVIQKNQIGKKFVLNEDTLKLKKVKNGDLYLETKGIEFKNLNDLRFVAYNSEDNLIHEPGIDIGPWNFQGTMAISPLFINEETLTMSQTRFQAYLRNLKFSKSDSSNVWVILMTDLDFDKIILLYPRYEFTPSKELEILVRSENVDNRKLIRHTFDLETEKSEQKEMINGN